MAAGIKKALKSFGFCFGAFAKAFTLYRPEISSTACDVGANFKNASNCVFQQRYAKPADKEYVKTGQIKQQ